MVHKNLPREIIDLVISFITSPGDLKCLCEVSKHLNYLATPKLYESVVVSTRSRSLNYLTSSSFPKRHLIFTRSLSFEAPLDDRENDHCLHYEDRRLETSLEESGYIGAPNRMTELGAVVADLCDHIPRDRLREFSWKMGVCVPSGIFGRDGCLLKKQHKIQSVELLTNAACSSSRVPHNVSFEGFDSIKRLSWQNVGWDSQLDSMLVFLERNAQHITELDLGLPAFHTTLPIFLASENWNYIVDDLIDVQGDSSSPLFQNLRHLSLSLVSFEDSDIAFTRVINWGQLRSLKLWGCVLAFHLLVELGCFEKQLQLTSLEVTQRIMEAPEDHTANAELEMVTALTELLPRFDTLKDLFIMMSVSGNVEPDDALPELIKVHANNLERLIYHEKTVNPDAASAIWGSRALDQPYELDQQFADLLSCPRLKCLGGTMKPSSLGYWLKEQYPRPSLKLIHFRRTTEVTEKHMDPYAEDTESTQSGIVLRTSGPFNRPVSSSAFLDMVVLELNDNNSPGLHDTGQMSNPERGQRRLFRLTGNPFSLALTIDGIDFARTLDAEVDRYSKRLVSWEFFEFAQWAFGPGGLPELELIAHGDFSDWGFRNIVLYRNGYVGVDGLEPTVHTAPVQLSFRIMKGKDARGPLLESHKDFLRACEHYKAEPGRTSYN